MIALRELQAAFARSMTSEAPVPLLALVAGDGSEVRARLAIYRNNVLSRLIKALRETYPVVCRLVDERFFDYAADAYVRTSLPTEGCLADYGDTFPEFLAAFPAASEIDYLPHVASLEWCIHRVRRATAMPSLPIEALASRRGDPATVRLRIAPWLGYLSSHFNVDQIWAVHQPEGLSQSLRAHSMSLCLQVHGLDGVTLSRLNRATWVFRASLARGDKLADAAAAAIRTYPEFDLAAALSALFSEGCVVELERDTGIRGAACGGQQQQSLLSPGDLS